MLTVSCIFMATLSTKACRAFFAWLKPACGHMKILGLSPFNIQANSVVAAKKASVVNMYNYAKKQVHRLFCQKIRILI